MGAGSRPSLPYLTNHNWKRTSRRALEICYDAISAGIVENRLAQVSLLQQIALREWATVQSSKHSFWPGRACKLAHEHLIFGFFSALYKDSGNDHVPCHRTPSRPEPLQCLNILGLRTPEARLGEKRRAATYNCERPNTDS